MNNQNLNQIKNNFLTELQKGARGEASSLHFIRHTLPKTSTVKTGEVFQVLVIGGSVFRNAIVKNIAGKIEIIERSEEALPTFPTQEEFMTFLESRIRPDIEVVVLNFAYPLTPILRDGIFDGALVSGSKENQFEGLICKNVGEEIEKCLIENHNRSIRVFVANDVICLLLSGLTQIPWNNLAAGIVGTGLNFAIFLDQHAAVNLESGDFSNFDLSDSAKEIDRLSTSPGKALFEKEVSGAYLYKHFNLIAKKRNLEIAEINANRELNNLLSHENSEVSKLARELLDHSASYVAVQIAGILEFAKRDLTFVMQGALFIKGEGYKELVAKRVNELSPNYHAAFLEISEADILGAAILVT